MDGVHTAAGGRVKGLADAASGQCIAGGLATDATALAGFADGTVVLLTVPIPGPVASAGTFPVARILGGGMARATRASLWCQAGLALAGFADGTVLLWQMSATAAAAAVVGDTPPLRCFRKHTAAIRALSLTETLVLAANSDGCVCLWDIQTGRCLRELSVARSYVRASSSPERQGHGHAH